MAKSSDPVYHCLIDTGALVMGFTNEEVAKLLLKLLPEELFEPRCAFKSQLSSSLHTVHLPRSQVISTYDSHSLPIINYQFMLVSHNINIFQFI